MMNVNLVLFKLYRHENQKFCIFTNVYPPCARKLIEKEQPTTVSGYLDLNGKYRGQYTI